MKISGLTAELSSELKKHQIAPEEIKAIAECDFDLDFNIRRTFLLLTESSLIVAVCPKSRQKTGSGKVDSQRAEDDRYIPLK